jgi:flagellar protein FlgJ
MLVRQLMQAGASPETAAKAAAAASGTAPAQGATATAGATGTAASWPPASREEFVDAIRPAAQRVAATLGVDADTLVAHAALETGWGRSLPRTPDGGSSFNLFGIKAGGSWQGAVASSRTHEFVNGARVAADADFRAYRSAEECLQDYARLLGGNPRYAEALNTGGDTAAFARALQRGGYATDPDYATKLESVSRQLKSVAAAPIPRTDTA